MENIKIVTLNVRGLRDDMKRRYFFHYFHKIKADIVFLQEVHSTREIAQYWSSQWGSKIYFSHGSANSKGVAILCKKTLNYEIHNLCNDDNGRFMILYCTINNHKVLLANVYAPNDDDPQFISAFVKEVTKFTPEYHIIGGDFNLVLDPTIDRQGQTSSTHKHTLQRLQDFMNAHELIDIWRETHLDKLEFTWYRMKPKPTFARLDFFLISDHLKQFVDHCTIRTGQKTDHAVVKLKLNFATTPRGPGYWKLNTSLLHDKEYIDKMNSLLDIGLSQEFQSYKSKWELIKLAVSGSSIQYSSGKKKSNSLKLQALEKKLQHLRNSLPFQPLLLAETHNEQLN